MAAPVDECAATVEIQDGAGPGFADVQALRVAAYGRDAAGDVESTDHHSYHVIAKSPDGSTIGSLRVTCRWDGPFEAEAAYPAWLLHDYRSQLSASSRLCVAPRIAERERLALLLMTHAWKEGARRGVRVDASKVRRKAIPYYLRLGAYFVRDSLFVFDRWNVECGIVVMDTRPSGGRFSPLFTHLPDAVDIYARHADRLTRRTTDVRRPQPASPREYTADDHSAA